MAKRDSKSRNEASPYPPLAFHLIRSSLLVSSLVVAGILSFFLYQLRHDDFKLPWTFLVLFGVAVISIIGLILTLSLHCCRSLSTMFSLIVHVPLTILWALGLILLGWNIAGTLSHACSSANWGSSTGIMICHTYKALFTFTLFGTVSVVALVILDILARRRQKRVGLYNSVKEPTYDDKPLDDIFSSRSHGDHHDPEPEPWMSAGRGPGDPKPLPSSRQDIQLQQFEYQPPSEQTQYDAGVYTHRGIR